MRTTKLKQTEIGKIPEDWKVHPLTYYLNLITYGFTNPMPTSTEGPFMITAKNINNGRILYEECRKTTQDSYNNLLTDKSRPRINDILLTKDGTLGRVAIVDVKDCCINQSVALLRPNKEIIPLFLKYLLEAPNYQKKMDQDSDGTVIKHIYITRVDKMLVAVPTIDEQIRIVQFLKNLDSEIELNQKMNKTFEAIVQTLFKYWFIDFDFQTRKGSPINQAVE